MRSRLQAWFGSSLGVIVTISKNDGRPVPSVVFYVVIILAAEHRGDWGTSEVKRIKRKE